MIQETILISLPLNQLENLINNSIAKALKEYSDFQNQSEKKGQEYLTRKQVANKLHLSLGTLDVYVKKGLINSYKIGHRVLFKSDEINESLFEKIQNQKFKIK
ncbi:helix-turn-helix domain-containing protein [Empedobacter falsenii]